VSGFVVVSGRIRTRGNMLYAFVSDTFFNGCAPIAAPSRPHKLAQWLTVYLPPEVKRRVDNSNGCLTDKEVEQVSEFFQRLSGLGTSISIQCYEGVFIVAINYLIDMNVVNKICSIYGWTPYTVFDAHQETEAMSHQISQQSGVPKPQIDHLLQRICI
jgi:hypothetical protein